MILNAEDALTTQDRIMSRFSVAQHTVSVDTWKGKSTGVKVKVWFVGMEMCMCCVIVNIKYILATKHRTISIFYITECGGSKGTWKSKSTIVEVEVDFLS